MPNINFTKNKTLKSKNSWTLNQINDSNSSIKTPHELKSSLHSELPINRFTKKNARNSILPYSVFEDYLLFKCYLDKPINQINSKIRTRQSGHLGKVY